MNSIKILSILKKLKMLSLGLALFLLAGTSFANTIVVQPNTVVSHSLTYDNVVLDMSNGSFIVQNNATLTIRNSIINGKLSVKNPLLINVDNGTLSFKNNKVNVTAPCIAPHPTTQSLQYVIQLGMAKLDMSNNSFEIDQPFRSGLLITTATLPTSGLKIVNNKIDGFHGALYLVDTDNALVSGNILNKNSYGNIVMIGTNSQITGNTVKFSGRNRLGDAIDIIDSTNITVSKNILLTPTCHGIYIFSSQNVLANNNRIYGGITYAMNILSFPEKPALKDRDYFKSLIGNHHLVNNSSSNIVISNNFMAQNRYGIAANDIATLKINDNIFVQRFEDNDARKFWTNNLVLLQNVTGLAWSNNFYKEAFTQDQNGSNSKSFKFVSFPTTGGVAL